MAKLKKTELTNLFPTLIEVLEAYGQTLVEKYRQGLREGDHIASGELYRTISTIVTQKKQSFLVEFRMPLYGEFLEQGTKPHFPPLDAIEDWIRVKKIVPRRDQQGNLPTVKQLAFLIARKISEDGTPATKIYEKANTLTYREWDDLIEEAISEDISNNLDEILKELGKLS